MDVYLNVPVWYNLSKTIDGAYMQEHTLHTDRHKNDTVQTCRREYRHKT